MKTKLLLVSITGLLAAATAQQIQSPILQTVVPKSRQVAALKLPPFTSPEAMQTEFVRRFDASPGFGFSRVIRPVFRAPTPELVWNSTTYRVVPPELIGLEDDPMAYAPREHSHQFLNGNTNQTRREVRKLFTHRALTALETKAILALRTGRDLVVLTNRVVTPEMEMERLATAPDLLVVGALRAGRDCAACHQCAPGSLLGAFAYTLTPTALPTAGTTHSPATRSNVLARLIGDRLALAPPMNARSKL